MKSDNMIEKMTEDQQKLIDKNVGMMHKFIRRKTDSGVIPIHLKDDFVSDMALKFCNSAVKFNSDQGFLFSTYAYGAFNMCYRELRDRKVPSYERNNFVSQEALWSFLNKTPADTEHVEIEVLQEMINKANLSQREHMILQSYFFENRSMAAIGRECNVSRERISQIVKRILNKLRRAACSDKLSFVDFYGN